MPKGLEFGIKPEETSQTPLRVTFKREVQTGDDAPWGQEDEEGKTWITNSEKWLLVRNTEGEYKFIRQGSRLDGYEAVSLPAGYEVVKDMTNGGVSYLVPQIAA